MVNIQKEVNDLYKQAIERIDSDFAEGKTLSFHHYAVKLSLDPHRLQREWTAHNYPKRKANEITATA